MLYCHHTIFSYVFTFFFPSAETFDGAICKILSEFTERPLLQIEGATKHQKTELISLYGLLLSYPELSSLWL